MSTDFKLGTPEFPETPPLLFFLESHSNRTADTQEHGKVKQMCFLIHKYMPWLFLMEEKGQRVEADEWAVTQESACMSYVYGSSL